METSTTSTRKRIQEISVKDKHDNQNTKRFVLLNNYAISIYTNIHSLLQFYKNIESKILLKIRTNSNMEIW